VGGDGRYDEFELPIYHETRNVVQPVCQQMGWSSKVFTEEVKDAKEPLTLANGTVSSLDANVNRRFPGMQSPEDYYL
jgi:hypothetical protein